MYGHEVGRPSQPLQVFLVVGNSGPFLNGLAANGAKQPPVSIEGINTGEAVEYKDKLIANNSV